MQELRVIKRDYLIPADRLSELPKPVQEAQAAADAAMTAYERAEARERVARQAAISAPHDDAQALADAARAGKKAPTPTAPGKDQEAKAAREARQLLRDDVEAAIAGLHRAIAAHAPELVSEQRPRVERVREQATAVLDQLQSTLNELEIEGKLLSEFAGSDLLSENGKRFKRVGQINFSPSRLAGVELQQLKSIVGEFAKFGSETAGQAQEREVKERERRKGSQLGVGNNRVGYGVHV